MSSPQKMNKRGLVAQTKKHMNITLESNFRFAMRSALIVYKEEKAVDFFWV
jgi:hypothetical protein